MFSLMLWMSRDQTVGSLIIKLFLRVQKSKVFLDVLVIIDGCSL